MSYTKLSFITVFFVALMSTALCYSASASNKTSSAKNTSTSTTTSTETISTLANLAVTVKDELTSRNIPSATVSIQGPKSATQTAELGVAVFTGLTAGTYQITVKADSYIAKVANIAVDPSQKNDYTGKFSLKPSNTALELKVKVIDAETSKPLNALVSIKGPVNKSSVASNGSSSFSRIPSGKYLVEASLDGYKTKSGSLELELSKSEYNGTFKLEKLPVQATATTAKQKNITPYQPNAETLASNTKTAEKLPPQNTKTSAGYGTIKKEISELDKKAGEIALSASPHAAKFLFVIMTAVAIIIFAFSIVLVFKKWNSSSEIFKTAFCIWLSIIAAAGIPIALITVSLILF